MRRDGAPGVDVGMSVFVLVSWSLGLGALACAAVGKKWKTESPAIHSFNGWSCELALSCEMFEVETSSSCICRGVFAIAS